jgi:hypothetical protein
VSHSKRVYQRRELLLNKPTNVVLGIDESNVISSGTDNAIVSSKASSINTFAGIGNPPERSTIVGGWNSAINGATGSMIAGATSCTIDAPDITDQGSHSAIFGGYLNNITAERAGFNVIAGGSGNEITGLTSMSGIIGGVANTIAQSSETVIAGGQNNLAQTGSGDSFFGGGLDNTMTNANRCAIIGGYSNTILNMNDAVMIGCAGKSATAAFTTHVEKLAILSIPTAPWGLPVGTVWRNGSALYII